MTQTPPPMVVSHFDGDVTIAVPPALARELAAVWSTAHATDPVLSETRPRWHDDVIALVSHAALADQQAGRGPEPAVARQLVLVHTETTTEVAR